MRRGCALLVALALGCSTTVHRLPGEVKTSAGPARTECEKQAWLVLAPTRSEKVNEDGRTTTPRRDGMALYRVGSNRPVSIPEAGRDLGDSPILDPHEKGVREYDRDRMIAAGMGIAGLIALVAGTALFVNSFHTLNEGTAAEEQRIDATKGTISGIVVAAGFGLGIGGLIINPTYAEGVRIENRRYVFLPPKDDPAEVKRIVGRHNDKVRDACRRIDGKAEGPESEKPADEEDDSEEDLDDVDGEGDAAEEEDEEDTDE